MTYLEILGWAHKGLVGERVALESKADLAASKGVKDLESYCRKQAAVMDEKLKVLMKLPGLCSNPPDDGCLAAAETILLMPTRWSWEPTTERTFLV